ncbi:RNA 2'-phosphotransferase [Agrococcus beijingensis]|uniref:RNA 2'-phosphotransferase n=1 Tax=Agrococcus beijingensis TaxID=3068634 RepID=UPI002740D7E2|nr:RNA 2'-phosphotransferase [Agrococcus sp. REN33]
MLDRLGAGDRANSYLVRDLRADIASSLARTLPPAEAVPYLQQAVEIRAGRQSAHLPLFQSYFRNAEDLFLHAQLDATQAPSLRRRALRELFAAPKNSAAEHAASLVLIASDVARSGANSVSGIGGDPEILIAVSHGNEGVLMQRAAEIILQESQLDDTKLGGRGEVRAVRGSEYDDRYSFVLKSTAKKQVDHDLWAQSLLRPALEALGRPDLLLTDHLCTVPRKGEAPGGDDVWEVRWYAPGEILSDYVRRHPGEQGRTKLRAAADYLGLFHRVMWHHPTIRESGQELRKRDLGMWLKSLLGAATAPEAFRSWRAACKHAPDMRRRDAHPDNWIVTESGGVVAFDFEASTSRPLFYELAQLVEDGQLLAPSDLEVRDELLHIYAHGLGDCAALEGLSKEEWRHLYAVGAMARCVRTASDREAPLEAIESAMLTFDHLEEWLDPLKAPTAFIDSVQSWWRAHPARQANGSGPMSDGQRTRISKAMSYNLRHNKATLVGRDGWVDVDHLVDAMRSNGHQVDVSTLLAVASAPEEHRFEVSGSDIRARYGHSKALALKTTRHEARPQGVLYHGTPAENLYSILDARAGLLRGDREFVHLSESIVGAKRPAERFKCPVIILKAAPETPGLLPESGGVWLAHRVPATRLTIVPLFEELGVA